LSQFGVSFSGLSLTSQSGKTVSLINTPQMYGPPPDCKRFEDG